MPGITNPAEEYFKDGLWGWVATAWKKLVATAGGALHIYIAGQAADVEVKQATPADLLVGVCTWDGAEWKRQPHIFGYSARYAELEYEDGVAAGDRLLTFSTVGEGQVRVVTQFSAYCDANNPTLVRFAIYDGSTNWQVDAVPYPTADCNVVCRNTLILKKDDRLRVSFVGCTGGEDVRAVANGYDMALDE